MQGFSPASEGDGWLQRNVRTLGSYAQTSTAAYSLATLFALSTPFGFASPAQAAAEAAATLQRQQALSQAASAASSNGSSSLIARIVASRAAASAQKAPVRPLPPFWQLAFFAAAFGTGGYIIDQGDALNGSGVVTAWSLTYLLFKTLPSAKELPRNLGPAGLSVAVLVLGLGVHGSHYFDRMSWRGAIPSMANAEGDVKGTHGRLLSFDTVGRKGPDTAVNSIFADTKSPSSANDVRAAESRSTQHLTGAQARNNDDARIAAFMQRQGSRSG